MKEFHHGDRGCANYEMWLRLLKEWVFEPNCLNWFLKSLSLGGIVFRISRSFYLRHGPGSFWSIVSSNFNFRLPQKRFNNITYHFVPNQRRPSNLSLSSTWKPPSYLLMVRKQSGVRRKREAETESASYYKKRVQGLAKRWSPGCVNAAGKNRQKW